jgi:biofilm PGA synthesis N-glycosyltransferase PgaC
MENDRERLDIGKEVGRDSPSYIAVTPAFNEEKNIEATMDSMIAQTAKPNVWVIVDDGSVDKTWDIIAAKAASYSWIKVHQRPEKQNPDADGLLLASEAEAFLEGLKLAFDVCPNPEFVVKLDADLKFETNYFMALFNEFAHDSRLGIAGGAIFEFRGSGLVREKVSSAHVRGATKVYRYSCYEDIGGIRPVFGWDVIDEILAHNCGWHVTSFNYLPLVHLRRTASREGRFRGWSRNGYMSYYIGMSPLRMLQRVVFRLIATGDLSQSLGLAHGYFRNFLRLAPRLPDSSLRKVIRRHQWVTVLAGLHRWCSAASRKGR